MSRLSEVFQSGKKILNIYCTAGYPERDSTLPIMQALQNSGVDIIELGMPYSDPLADGEAIQKSSSIALSNGMTMKLLFEQLKDMRRTINIPVILMGYMNPVLQYGFEKFCADASAVGIDGLILPDLPQHEFEQTYKEILDRYHLHFIFLVTPETSEERVKQLDALSSGFLYAVSSSSTTGGDKDFEEVEQYIQRLNSYHLKNPLLVGFGVKDRTSFKNVCTYTSGAIIGSAYIKSLQGSGTLEVITKKFVQGILN